MIHGIGVDLAEAPLIGTDLGAGVRRGHRPRARAWSSSSSRSSGRTATGGWRGEEIVAVTEDRLGAAVRLPLPALRRVSAPSGGLGRSPPWRRPASTRSSSAARRTSATCPAPAGSRWPAPAPSHPGACWCRLGRGAPVGHERRRHPGRDPDRAPLPDQLEPGEAHGPARGHPGPRGGRAASASTGSRRSWRRSSPRRSPTPSWSTASR